MRLAPSARAAVAAAALLAAGCTSSNERLYYQTRYLPTEGGDVIYSAHERTRWTGDTEVYELPASPPGLDDEHVARRECLPPGARFKPQLVAGMDFRDRAPAGAGAVQPVGDWDQRHLPTPLAEPGYGLPLGGQRDEEHGPALVKRVDQVAGGPDGRPLSRTGAGVDTLRGDDVGGTRNQDKWDYCLDPQLQPGYSPDR